MDYDTDDFFDENYENTGTDKFTIDYKFIDFKKYPNIYNPFYSHMNDIPDECILNIMSFMKLDDIISLKNTNTIIRNIANNYIKTINKKFCNKDYLLKKKQITKLQNKIKFLCVKRSNRVNICRWELLFLRICNKSECQIPSYD